MVWYNGTVARKACFRNTIEQILPRGVGRVFPEKVTFYSFFQQIVTEHLFSSWGCIGCWDDQKSWSPIYRGRRGLLECILEKRNPMNKYGKDIVVKGWPGNVRGMKELELNPIGNGEAGKDLRRKVEWSIKHPSLFCPSSPHLWGFSWLGPHVRNACSFYPPAWILFLLQSLFEIAPPLWNPLIKACLPFPCRCDSSRFCVSLEL